MLDHTQTQSMQRARGRVHLEFCARDVGTKLTDLHQSGSAKALLPKNHADRIDAVIINTAGGVTGGNRLVYSVSLEASAELCITTQTAERIYKSSGGFGQIEPLFTLAEDTAPDWLPQETILFE